MLDYTIITAHRASAGMASDGLPSAIGGCAGGITTKVQLFSCNGKNTFDFTLTGGQVNAAKEGCILIHRTSVKIETLLSEKAFDSNKIRKYGQYFQPVPLQFVSVKNKQVNPMTSR